MSNLLVIRKGVVYTFGIPLLGLHKGHFKHYLVNAFLGDKRLQDPAYESGHIFILLRYEDSQGFRNVETFLEGLGHYEASYDVLNGTYVMYVFKVFEDMQEDYKRFIAGKYSEFSQDYRALIELHTPNAKVRGILNKDPLLKEQLEERIGTSIGNLDVYSIPEDFPYAYFTEDFLNELAKQTQKV